MSTPARLLKALLTSSLYSKHAQVWFCDACMHCSLALPSLQQGLGPAGTYYLFGAVSDLEAAPLPIAC